MGLSMLRVARELAWRLLVRFWPYRARVSYKRPFAWACARLGGHRWGPDWGYAGGGRVDVWCYYCDIMTTLPLAEWPRATEVMDRLGIQPGDTTAPPAAGG